MYQRVQSVRAKIGRSRRFDKKPWVGLNGDQERCAGSIIYDPGALLATVPMTGYFLAILSAQSCSTSKSCSFKTLTSGLLRCSGANDICDNNKNATVSVSPATENITKTQNNSVGRPYDSP